MKRWNWWMAVLGLGWIGLLQTARAAIPSVPTRTDINPALLYWQAIVLLPVLSEADHDHVFKSDWRGRAFDPPFGDLITRYGSAFRLLRQASEQKVPCDWGYDLSRGPELELPGLAWAKSLAVTTRLRVRWHLEHGRPEAARDEWLSAMVLARQLGTDRVLISALVQIAMENILVSSIAENWFRFEPKTLDEIVAGLDLAPARAPIVQCVTTERTTFRNWLVAKIRDIQKTPGSEAEALRKAMGILAGIEPEKPDLAEKAVRAAGGTTEGLVRLLEELDGLYDEVDRLVTLPHDRFMPKIKEFEERVAQHTNAFVPVFFSAFGKCRIKEFAVQSRLAMLRAAVEFRRSSEPGLARVPDPVTGQPFQFARVRIQGEDRGFELRSRADLREWPEVQIFLEKDGPAFHLDGPNAGKVAD